MPHWLALALPALPLQLAQRRFDPALARTLALAVIDGPVQRARVAYCNGPAAAAGIHSGMALAAAQALSRTLITLQRDPVRERAALHELACWAYQFSAQIVTDARGVTEECGPDSVLLLETGASERLFGGRVSLHRRIQRELQQLGYEAASASAATPGAARLLARARAAGRDPGESAAAADPQQLARILGPLPHSLFHWAEPVGTRLAALGLDTIGEVLALPRDALARRLGTDLLVDLDRALGRCADPQPPFHPPERFSARAEMPADIIDVARLLPPLQRLLLLLEGFLRGHGAGATALLLTARHSPRRTLPLPHTQVPLALAAPERDPQRLLQLYAERLARIRLAAPVVLLELQLERMAGYIPSSGSFLPPSPHAPGAGSDILQLAELLHARLGSEGVFQLQARSDHRPECAYRLLPLTPDPPRQPDTPPAPAQRPLLLLPVPCPLAPPAADHTLPAYRGALALLAGPERIETGWWEQGPQPRAIVHRDYYVARNPRGQTVWVYRELAAPQRWFLHGFFA
jgi:protein ImuB